MVGPGESLQYELADNLSADQRHQMADVVDNKRSAFVTTDSAIGKKADYQVSIDLKPGAKPSNRPPYKTTPLKQKYLDCIELLLKNVSISMLVHTWTT